MFWKISYQTLHFESNLSLIQFRFIYAAPNYIFSISESEALTSFLFFFTFTWQNKPRWSHQVHYSHWFKETEVHRGGLHLTQRKQSGKDRRPKVLSGENVKKRK